MSRQISHVCSGFVITFAMIAGFVVATLPSSWEIVCATFSGDLRDGKCPIPARLDAAMTVYRGVNVTIFGGSGGIVPKSDLWTYDSTTKSWTMNNIDWREYQSTWTEPVCSNTGLGAHLTPRPRYNSLVGVDTGGLLIVGGGTCSDYDSQSNDGKWKAPVFMPDFWFYSPESMQWIAIKANFTSDSGGGMPNVTNFTSVLYDHKVYIFGGVNGTYYSNTLWEVDIVPDVRPREDMITAPSIRKVVPADDSPLPDPRSDHTAVVSGTRMYVFGGHNTESAALDDMWTYDFDTHYWNKTVFKDPTDAPLGRYAHSSAVCRGASPDMSDLIVIFGGIANGTLCDSFTYGYSIGQRIWIKLSDQTTFPTPRVHASLACGADGELWLFGGVDATGVVNDFYRMY